MLNRMKELIETLNNASDAYYNASMPLISDYEWDCMFDELKKLESKMGISLANSPTRNVGFVVKSNLEKVKHSHPMLSLGKTKSVSELREFASKNDAIMSLKLDGLTVLLTYEGGKLVKAETRGNGEIGEDVTHNAYVFENIPLRIPISDHFEIEGEAIITYEDFEKINSKLPEDKKYKNPRNLVSGSVRQLDSEIAAKRHIKFIAWKLPKDYGTFKEAFEEADNLGFDVVPYCPAAPDIIETDIDFLKYVAEKESLPIDGLVCTYNDMAYGVGLGMTGHHPRHSIAFKFYEDEEVTTLRDIEWSMGKVGDLTPVAIFDPVELNGTTVTRASLHNLSICKELEIGIGDEIVVIKANEIIPQVRDNLTRSGNITIPNACPICGGKVEIRKTNNTEVVVCANDDCSGKLLGKLSHFASRNAINIDGLSEATLDKFISLGWLKSFKDIYHLVDYKGKIMNLDGFGRKSAEKLLINIEESRKTTLDRFLYSLSIPLIGRTASKAIAKNCSYSFDTFVQRIESNYNWTKLDDFGDTMNKSINEYFKHNLMNVKLLAEEFTFDTPAVVTTSDLKDLTGKVFVITGSLTHFANRDEAKQRIEMLGGKVSGSVSKSTSYLVNNDIESTSSKNKKAKELGVPIINEMQLLSLIR